MLFWCGMSAGTISASSSAGGAGDDTQGLANTLMDRQVGQSIGQRRAVGFHGASVAPRIVTESPEIGRRHGLLAAQPMLRLGFADSGPIALGKSDKVIRGHGCRCTKRTALIIIARATTAR